LKITRHYGQIPPIQGYAAQLNQVWTNIISNALEAMHNKGELTLQTEKQGNGTVAVRLIDSGPGIPEEHKHRVFDLNFTTKHAGAGFGLGMGLLICRQIVNRHGGSINIDSRPGRTVVEVILPIESRIGTNGNNHGPSGTKGK
jgi:signal transduction histidine kinase